LSAALAALIAFTVSDARPAHALNLEDYFTYTYSMELSHEEVVAEQPFTATISGQATCIQDLPISPSKAEFRSRAIGRHAVSGAEVVLNEDYVLTISPFPSLAGETTEETAVVPMFFPPDSEPGTYTVIGELIQARLRLVVWVDVTSELPSEQVLGTITLAPELLWIAVTPENASVAAGLTQQFTATGTYSNGSTEDLTATAAWDSSDADVAAIDATGLSTAITQGTTTITAALGAISDDTTLTVTGNVDPGGNGGDPANGAGEPAPPDGPVDWGECISEDGEFTRDVTTGTSDGGLSLSIREGTTGIDGSGEPVRDITIDRVETAPTEAGGLKEVVGNAYELGPDGATFDRPLVVKFTYDESLVPDGLAERQLVAAFWEDGAEIWVPLEGSEVDPVNNSVTARIDHFTVVAVVAPIRPADFTISNLRVTPPVVGVGRTMVIRVDVSNTGDLRGTYEVTLRVDGSVAARREVSVGGAETQTVKLTTKHSEPGTHDVEIGHLSATFTVEEAEVPPASAAFTLSGLTSTPAEIEAGESVNASVVVTNTGDLEGDYPVVLMVDGASEETKTVTMAGGASETVIFSVSRSDPGVYAIEIGDLTTTFVVKKQTPSAAETPASNGEESERQTPWVEAEPSGVSGLLVGIITGVVALAVAVASFVWRRRYWHRTDLSTPLGSDTFTEEEGE